MERSKDYTLMKIFVNESNQYKGQSVYRAIVRKLSQEKIKGATVFRGITGFGAENQIHTVDILRLSVDLPVVVEVVDTEKNIERILPEIKQMIGESLVTLEKVTVF
jgi:PII-like signaling protein